MQLPHDKALNKAKIALMSKADSAFLSTILFSLDFEWNDSIRTADVDGVLLRINQHWFMQMPEGARVGLLAHEAWHVGFKHMIRGANLDHKRFGKAADYVINNMLLATGYELPANGLWDIQYADMSTEQVYALLPVSDPADPYDVDIIYEPDADPEISDELDEKITDILIKAAQQSKMQNDKPGTIPGEIEILIEQKINPKLAWNVILQNYMAGYAKEDYSFSKPNRRYFPDYYLPSMYSDSLDSIAVAIDTSISVSDEELAMFLAEIEDIRVTLHPKETTIVGFDTKINVNITLTENDSIEDVVLVGRGGTSLHPVFRYFESKPPTVLIVFSDLECPKIQHAPDFDVIWICVNNPRASVNFGELIHLET